MKYAVSFFFLSIGLILAICILDWMNILSPIGLNRNQYICLIFFSFSLQILLASWLGKAYENARREFEIRLLEIARIGDIHTLAAGVSHEINSPMTVIRNIAELCEKQIDQKRFDETKAKWSFTRIKNSVDSVTRIIKLLQAYTGEEGIEAQTKFFVDEIISDTLALCHQRLVQSGILLKISSPKENISITANRSEISRSLMALINNSYDAVTQVTDRWILVSLRQRPAVVEIRVEDSGLGVPESLRRYLFTPFFTTKPPGKGIGLALYHTARIINQHNGRVYFDEKSKNTSFVILLPS